MKLHNKGKKLPEPLVKKNVVMDLTVTDAQLKHILSHLKMIQVECHVRDTDDECCGFSE